MNKLFIKFLVFFTFCLFYSNYSEAQFTISEKIDAKPRLYNEKIIIPDSSSFDIITPGWIKELKRRKRHERHFFETHSGILFNQFAYVNWAGGGENSINGKFTTLNTHSYKVGRITVDSYLNAALGFGQKDSTFWKTDDKLEINSIFNYQLWGKWTFSAGMNLATQFAPGYGDNKDIYTSKFFAPATLKPFAGISYRHSDSQIVTFAPISGNFLFVCDDRLSNEGAFGITPGNRFKATIGSFLSVQWTQDIDKKGILKYKTNFQSFIDYKTVPSLSWENWLNLTVFKYLTVGFYIHLVYDQSIEKRQGSSTHWQVKENLGVGIAYNFKNKDQKPDNSKYTKLVKYAK